MSCGRRCAGAAGQLVVLLFALSSTVTMAGCKRQFFEAKGSVASEGGELQTWRSAPDGCSRDPFDGLGPGQSSSVVTFVWEDPAARDSPLVQNRDRFTRQDAPFRLEIAKDGKGFAGNLMLVRLRGSTRLDQTVCKTLHVDAEETPASYAEGRPTLAGTLTMDCKVRGSHLTADLRFARCEF